MVITEYVNNAAVGLTGFTAAGAALSTAIIGWVMFWTRMAKLIPTEWKNPFLGHMFKILNLICRILGFDWPDIAKIQWWPFRIITRAELTATQVVAAAVIPAAIETNPQPPAVPEIIDGEVKNV